MTKEENYKQHIQRWQRKGGSIREYCRENKISYDIFQYWRRKKEYWQNKYNAGVKGSRPILEDSPPKDTSFIPIEIKDTQEIEIRDSVVEICIHTDGNIKIRVGQIQ
jgi:hypothetical protein